ncbi:hypothetical protein [Streptomyces sp. JW3]|uniref:hypothetical protein n=1 Tax=Streptomyces sp. JW3 TaxID=3456955 RepID=UPI003FA4C69F
MTGDGPRDRGDGYGPGSGAVPARPAPAAASCPGCHHRHAHATGCELAALTVADAAALGHDAALALLHDNTFGAPPPPAPACPACHHTHAHQPGCPLTPLPVTDAAALGYEAALARVRAQGGGLPQPGGPPPPAATCPGCHHQYRHQRGCALEPLPVEQAALLGYDAALNRAHALRAPPATAPPPPADTCPACHHTRRHRPGCELAALPVAEASVLGHRAALDLLRVRAASGPPDPPGPSDPPDPPAPGFFRRLLLRGRRR